MLRVGFVRMPGGGGIRFASRVQEDGRDLLIPPSSLARIMGEVRRGLTR